MKNEINGIWETVYITMLWGAPIGRTIQPTLAAIVCSETVGIIKSILSSFFKANIANGTKMINDTSLVIKIELKKHIKTNINTRPLVLLILTSNFRTSISKMARFFKTSTTSIITKSNIMVSQLM